MFPLADMTVVDLGGTPSWWERAPVRPQHVTIVNLTAPEPAPPWITQYQADACTFEGAFDLVLSNSVLEHVGGHAQRCRFAETVQALAPKHWIQTPYRYFPI